MAHQVGRGYEGYPQQRLATAIIRKDEEDAHRPKEAYVSPNNTVENWEDRL